jgi:hypothetical protein
LAEALGKPPDAVACALDAAVGLDGHDWWHHVAKTLSLDHGVLWKALVDVWARNPANQEAALGLIEELSQEG